MKYYMGTYEDCNIYNEKVNLGEGYVGTTTKWAEVTKHHLEDVWAIAKHEDYSSEELEAVDELPEDWYPDVEI